MENLVGEIKSLKDIGNHKGLAKIGDPIVNLIYSQARSIVTGHLDVRHVNRTILCSALKQSDLKQYTPPRPDAHTMADTAEAFVGYVYCVDHWGIDEMALILLEQLKDKKMEGRTAENEAAAEAFTALLLKIKKHLLTKIAA